jgi:ubiquinone/menaquinone biosynthesis C-methylase UbiE
VNQVSTAISPDDVGLTTPNVAPSAAPARVSVTEGYARWAPTYDRAPNPLLNLEERKLTPLLPSLSGKHVLDLACGTGRWLAKLSTEDAGPGVGIDLSTAMLRVAARKAAIRGRLARADCLSLPFRASVFDLVVCSFALGHIRDLAVMVHELARVTKSGAEVFVSDSHPEAYAQGWRTGFRDSRSAVQIDTSPRTAEEIMPAFYSEGFECLTHVSFCLGEPEKAIFAQAGKSHLFPLACQVPAVLVCQFRRVGSAMGYRGAR